MSLEALVRPKLQDCKMSTNGEVSGQDCDCLSVDLQNVERRQSVISLGEAKAKNNKVSLTRIFEKTRKYPVLWRTISSS